MFVQYAETPNSLNNTSTGLITPTRIAVVLGLIVGSMLALLMPSGGFLKVAMWPLGLAISLLATGLVTVQRAGESRWDLVFAGQILGVTAVAILFFAWVS